MVVDALSLKRVKRCVMSDLNDFLTFPSLDANGLSVTGGTFRSNIKEFLTRHALLPPPSSLFPHLTTWQILFRVADLTDPSSGDGSPVVVVLDVVEEDVARSRSVYCDQCRVVGWSGHPVCCKRYHIIVKGDGTSIGGHLKRCSHCGSGVHMSEPRCKSCNNVMTSENVEDWMYQQLEDTSHLLHGVIHENGYGHLLRINGKEGGSKFLSGSHIMDFWDRLCRYLGVRKISVMDVSKKYGLEYRLLHAITKGHPWYGNWGYEFGAGSFALTQEGYQLAVNTLSTLPLSTFTCQGRKPRTRVQDLILYYQSLSERELVNVRDLFDFLMTSVHNAPKISSGHEGPPSKKRRLCTPGVLSSWTSCDVMRVETSMIRVLKAVTGSNWVNWRTLRGAVFKSGPPNLVDDCLKELVGKQASDNLFVHARQNPQSGALEYRLESVNASLSGDLPFVNRCSSHSPSKDHMIRDLRYLYESLLHPLTMLTFGTEAKREVAIMAATQLLDCKQFVKDYEIAKTVSVVNSSSLSLFCKAELFDQFEEEDAKHAISPPPELITLPQNATISDLKQEASRIFQEIYIVFTGFHGEELLGYSGLDDSTHVNLVLRPLQTVTIRGRCNTKNKLSEFRMERGIERWTVDCSCGAQDDDGERMLACDVCSVWQHTRCAGIHDFDVVPARFVCGKCMSTFKMAILNTTGQCKDEASVQARTGRGGKSLPRGFMSANFCAL